jgi:hypothetical protein
LLIHQTGSVIILGFTALDKVADPMTPQSWWSTHKWYFYGTSYAIILLVLLISNHGYAHVQMAVYLSFVVHLVGFYVNSILNDQINVDNIETLTTLKFDHIKSLTILKFDKIQSLTIF